MSTEPDHDDFARYHVDEYGAPGHFDLCSHNYCTAVDCDNEHYLLIDADEFHEHYVERPRHHVHDNFQFGPHNHNYFIGPHNHDGRALDHAHFDNGAVIYYEGARSFWPTPDADAPADR